MRNIDEYLAGQPLDVREALEKLRTIIKSVAPKAEELISYQVPAFRMSRMLVSFGAAKNHCSFYVMSPKVMNLFKDELEAFKTSAGSIQFTPEKPIPAALVKRIVKARIKENDHLVKNKKH
jgi:uncharacterized protein YdhG (YjbR/CyaY superfamily)